VTSSVLGMLSECFAFVSVCAGTSAVSARSFQADADGLGGTKTTVRPRAGQLHQDCQRRDT